MRRLLAALAVVAGTLVPATAVSAAGPHAPTADAAGQLGIQLVDAPLDRRNDPRARIYVVDHMEPGARISRRIKISNTTKGPLTVRTYAGPATLANGAFQLGDRGTTNELTSWTSITPRDLVVPASGSSVATVTIAVPKAATSGERYGVIWAEADSGKGGNVQAVNRVGVRMYLDVGAGAEPASDFSVDSLQAVREKDGTPVVLAQVHNTGARALDMRGKLSLTDGPGGLSAGPFDATVGTTLAPGATGPVRVALAKSITGGPWKATLTMMSGELQRKVEGQITFPDAAGSSSPPVTPKSVPLYKDRGVVGTVAAVLVGTLLLLLLLAFWFLVWRRRKDKDESVAS